MSKLSQNQITQMLLAWRAGNTDAVNELFALVYNELRRVAGAYMRSERSNHTLQPTALVNEVYLRLVNQPSIEWQNRAHFFGIAARLMRQVLIEYARAHNADKRGGKQTQIDLDEADLKIEQNVDLLALDEALKKFETFNTFGCKVVELRFFGGLSQEEIAEVIGVSESTVKREWKMAKAWLLNELEK
jgi:RNA polymerase sigma-70 factor, ECF subfamily